LVSSPRRKKLSNEDQMDNLVIPDMPKTVDERFEIVAKEGRLGLRHSSAAHVLTNDDLDDIDSSSSTGNSGGEMAHLTPRRPLIVYFLPNDTITSKAYMSATLTSSIIMTSYTL
jgi:hypothetical protein